MILGAASLDALAPFTVYILVFSRVGACLMLMPGYATSRIPAQARLAFALAVSLSITPLVEAIAPPARVAAAPLAMAVAIAGECLVGVVLGLAGRLFVSAIQVGGSLIAQLSGYSGIPVSEDGSGEPQPEIAALLSVTVVVLLLSLDFHADVLRALIESYLALPAGEMADPAVTLDRVADALATSFRIAVRISGPFLIAGVMINFAFGLVNKIAPQIPAVFVSVPFVLAAALWILERMGPEIAAGAARTILDLHAAQ